MIRLRTMWRRLRGAWSRPSRRQQLAYLGHAVAALEAERAAMERRLRVHNAGLQFVGRLARAHAHDAQGLAAAVRDHAAWVAAVVEVTGQHRGYRDALQAAYDARVAAYATPAAMTTAAPVAAAGGA